MQTLDDPIRLIRQRRSFRTYAAEPLPGDARTALEEALAAPPAGPFGTPIRLGLVRSEAKPDEPPRKLGTYGMIRGARDFLAGSVAPGPRAMEDFGYVFEWAILAATQADLATCWLGGTLQRGAFADALGAAEDEVVPAVSPVGKPAARQGIVHAVTRWMAGSKNRKPWEDLFYDGGFHQPLSSAAAGPLSEALEMVRLGPSASNKQPWRIVREGAQLHLYLQRTRGYRKMTSIDLQRLDCGIAMCHLELASKHAGLDGHWGDAVPALDELPPRTEYVATWTAEG